MAIGFSLSLSRGTKASFRTGTRYKNIGESMRVKWMIVVVGLVSACALLGCTGGKTKVEEGNEKGVLHMGNGAEPQALDPHVVTGVPEHNIIVALLEGLVSEDPVDLHPVPGVARSWDINESGTEYTFHLRDDALWSDGSRVTAEHFVYSFRRILSPALGSEYAYMLYPMKNAEKFHKGEISDFAEVGARAVDDTTLRIELGAPTPYFLQLLTHYSWFPVHPSTIEEFGEIDERGTRWTRPENYVGNGPFVLSEWKMNEVIAVEKNPNYWDHEQVSLSGIRFYPIENAQTEERTFRSGDLHVTHTVPPNKISWYRENAPEELRIDPYFGTYYYLVNTTRDALKDSRVRRALAMTIDRESIIKTILKGDQSPAYHFTPPQTAGYTSPAKTSYDPEAARALLAEAGFPGGEGFPGFELLYNTQETHHMVAQAIQQMWNKELGIEVTLTNQEWKVYLATTQRIEHDVARAGWIGDYLDPNTFLNLWVTDGGNNRTGWSHERYDSLLQAASLLPASEERLNLFGKAETILMDQMPVIPIYFYTSNALVHTSVENWNPTIMDHHPYKYVRLSSE